ncbi:MAG: phosphomethylpyrimidine synthase ThiC, partial [Sphingobium sp.]
MADIPARTELTVTTGPIRGSKKIHVPAQGNPNVRVAMREIHLEPGSGEAPVRVYDTSGPYTDPDIGIDIMRGLPTLRRDWIMARGDVEEYDARAVKPEDNGLSARAAAAITAGRNGGVEPFPHTVRRPLRAKAGANVTQMYYARRGI